MSAAKTTEARPITPNMKVGDVIKEHPELVDVLVAQSQHFSRLKNPVLRHIHGRLVTVAQAAAVAGIDPAALVLTLNKAIGQDTKETTPFQLISMAGAPEPPWVNENSIAVHLDVREDQRRHADPFQRIMAAVAELQNGQVLHLKNTFEPLPLYDVLGKRGFVAWARKVTDEEWDIYFLKLAKQPVGEARQVDVPEAPEIETEIPVATVVIDISDLTPPQPMLKIMDALANLKSGETLLVHHQRRPAYLYPKLAELGYSHKTVEKGPNQVDIYIHKS